MASYPPSPHDFNEILNMMMHTMQLEKKYKSSKNDKERKKIVAELKHWVTNVTDPAMKANMDHYHKYKSVMPKEKAAFLPILEKKMTDAKEAVDKLADKYK